MMLNGQHTHRQLIGRVRLVASLILLVIAPSLVQGQFSAPEPECGSLENHYGPYDYTNPTHKREKLPVVEQYHFNEDVFSLRRGLSSKDPLGDLDYTLRAFPNHHMALDAMARLHRRANRDRLPNARYSLSCWFERAARFNPSDGSVQMIHGIHLFKLKRFEEAEVRLLRASELMPRSSETQYNLGLLYVQLGRYELAREYAIKAYSMGFPLPGLRNQLIRLDVWPDEE